MVWLIVLFVVLIMIMAFLTRQLPSAADHGFPYQLADALFTPAERSFLGVLDKTMGSRYRVIGKIRIADVVCVKPMANAHKRQAAFNKISCKHFDFVLCDPADLSPVAVIELDDRSHSARKRRERDEFIAGVCRAAGLPLLRVPARRAYTSSDIERLIVSRLPDLPQDAKITPADVEARPAEQPTPTPHISSQSAAVTTPPCPKCASIMILRRVRKGPRAGEPLWGCSEYPRCRGIRPYDDKSRGAVRVFSDAS